MPGLPLYRRGNEGKAMQKEKSYWRNWYIIVFVFLVLQIVLYYFITQHFKN
jgi:hypothetical protein